jgi:hypothetical protein
VEKERLELLGSSAMLTAHTLPSGTDISYERPRCET